MTEGSVTMEVRELSTRASVIDIKGDVTAASEQALGDLTETETHDFSVQLRSARSDIEGALVSRDLALKLLTRLSAEDRLVLTLLDVEGFSVAEISEMTNWSISKVKVRAHRARAHLRRIMKKFL